MNLYPTQRHLPLEGMHNLRDLGGYPTSDGRITRWHTFLRGDAPHRLSEAGQQTLLDLGLHTVIDLRFAKEIEEAPNLFAGEPEGALENGTTDQATDQPTYVHISLMDGFIQAATNGQSQSQNGVDGLEAIYRGMLTHCQPALRTVFEAISAAEGKPVLFHCVAGKDRTGLVAALLLGVAGVAHETIAQDYALTDHYLTALKQELRDKAAASGQDLAQYERMLESKPEAMLNTLAFIDQHYGGASAYLQQIGLSQEQVHGLQIAMIG